MLVQSNGILAGQHSGTGKRTVRGRREDDRCFDIIQRHIQRVTWHRNGRANDMRNVAADIYIDSTADRDIEDVIAHTAVHIDSISSR